MYSRIAGSITAERTMRYKENEENETTAAEQTGDRGKGGERMKKRIRGMTSASRGEKGRKKRGEMDAVEREWQNGASERRASHWRHEEKQRRTKKAVGRFARVATLSCERREETGYMTMKREKRSTGRSVGRMNERRRERRKCEGAHRVGSRRR